MFEQFWQDVLALVAAIQAHSLSSIVIAAIALVSLFSAQIGSVLSSVWGFISGFFQSK